MKKLVFEGAGVAIATPFNTDGSVNYEQLKNLIEYQIEGGINSIITCGTTGESSTLTEKEHVEVIDFTIKTVNKRIPVIAGTGSNDTSFCVELSQEAELLGADGLLVITPYYNKTSQKGLIESFTKVADNVKSPIILYNVPSRTGVNILPETYKVLCAHENIVATKEANYDIGALAKTISLCGENLNIYSGEDSLALPIMALGGKGVISVLANICPKAVSDLAGAMLKEDYANARALTSKYVELMDAMFMDVNPIPVKEALSLMGFCENVLRLPLTTMPDEKSLALKNILRKYNLI